MRAPLVDYHCHLDLYRDCESVFAAARSSDVEIFAVTTTPLAWEQNCKLAMGASNVRVGLGLHPHLVGTPSADVRTFERLAPRVRFIGEIGLDAGPKWYKSFALQTEIFSNALELCVDYPGKVLSIHCVRAYPELFSLLDKHWSDDAGTLILHWFSGSLSEAKRAMECGCFFSVNSEMIRRPQGRRLLEALPIQRLLTETDGPFISDLGGNAFRPADVRDTVAAIASIKDMPLDEVISTLWRNVQTVEAL